MTKIKLWTISLFILFVSLSAYSHIIPATQSTVAYINSNELLKAFPERKQATEQLLVLSEEYKKELEQVNKSTVINMNSNNTNKSFSSDSDQPIDILDF